MTAYRPANCEHAMTEQVVGRDGGRSNKSTNGTVMTNKSENAARGSTWNATRGQSYVEKSLMDVTEIGDCMMVIGNDRPAIVRKPSMDFHWNTWNATRGQSYVEKSLMDVTEIGDCMMVIGNDRPL
uniref:Retrotransposon protein n=1 Tax=Globodera pallida TaxID=36090 RepID=A0A183CPV4_GLOPA